jgi:hypothetical protein
VPEVDRGPRQQVPLAEGPRCVVACSPSSAEVSCGLVVRLPGAAPQPRPGRALLPLGVGQGDRDPGVAPRACGAAPPASPAPPAADGPRCLRRCAGCSHGCAGRCSWYARRRCCAGTGAWVRRRWTYPTTHRGRPPLSDEVQQLVVWLARENPRWGDQRIHGELLRLGVRVSASSIRRVLRAHGLDPAPGRGPTSWRWFLPQQATWIVACDFFTSIRCCCGGCRTSC